jgi:membrane fusion protein, multidrug efflux system
MVIRKAAKGVLGVMVLSGLIFWSYTGEVASSRGAELPRISPSRVVKAARVSRLQSGPTVRLSAVTRAEDHTQVAFAIGGRIRKRPVEVGDVVQKGALLARLDPESLAHAVQAGQASIDEIEVRLDQAGRDSLRMASLAEIGAVASAAEESVHASRDALAAAKATAEVRLSEARRRLGESALRAPFDGVVTAVLREPGEVVAPGATIVVLDGDGGVEVEIEVPESLVARLAVGETVTVDLPLVGRHGLQGTIAVVGKSALGPGGLFPVIVTLPEGDGIRGGLTAEVVLPAGAVSGLGVPVSAVLNPSGHSASVLKVDRGKAVRVPVTTHALVGEAIEVAGDLKAGDLVIVSGHQQLLGDESVEVLK